MITVENFSADFGFAEVSFTAKGGAMLALVGPNGSGKTTLLKALAELIPARGKRTIEGRVAYLPQKLEFLPTMAVRDVVALGRAPYRGRLGKLSETDQQAVETALHATCVEHLAGREVGTLSGGEQARVGLARALAVEADILIVDEPTASLDMAHALDMISLLRAQAERGVLVLCALHDLALAATQADRVLMMSAGRLVGDGPLSLLSDGLVTEVFGISPPHGGWKVPERASMPRA
jgi:iron complex transport system ATP-binding protein